MARTDTPPPPRPAAPPGTAAPDITPRLLIENWHGEKNAAALYRALAGHEKSKERAQVLEEIARAEDRHAAVMEARLRELGVPLPRHRTAVRVRLLSLVARVFGPQAVLPIIESFEAKNVDAYRAAEQDPAVQALAADERGHFRTIGRMARGTAAAPTPTTPPAIAQQERWHRGGGSGTLRASIFGVSDGLVSNLSLVMGFAGAQAESKFVVLAGIAGLLAGAGSMAAGEYVSMRSQRELFERQISLERTELLLAPEEERQELALIYRAKGVPADEAERLASRLLENKEAALDTLVREELGLDPAQLGSPWGAASGSFVAFALGAVVPVIPYFLGASWLHLAISAALSAAALFAVGVAVSFFTGRAAWYGGLRQLLIGAAAAGITYGIGTAIGASTGI